MPRKGYKQTEKHKRKIGEMNSISLKGRKLSAKHKEKLKGRIPWNKGKKTGIAYWLGKKRSPEDIEKFKKSHLGKKYPNRKKPPKFSEKHLENMSKNSPKYWLGKKMTEVTKEKIKRTKRENGSLVGEKNPNWKGGKPKCEDCGKQLSNYGIKYCKKCYTKHLPQYKGGISNDKNYINFLNNKRKRLKKIQNKNGISHTFGEWELLKKQYGYTCPACGRKEPTIKLCEDHIIPLSKGGADNIENIQPLCGSCNSVKHTKIIKFSNKHFKENYSTE